MSDHIITNSKNGKFKCEFCGVEEEPPFMPAPIDVIIDAMDYFIDQHKDCKPKPTVKPYSPDDINYIAGFDHGCDYIVAEIERFEREAPSFAKTIPALLARLKMEDKK